MASVNKVDVFQQALLKVFKDWTALSLCVEHGMGGRDSYKKREELYQAVLDMFINQPASSVRRISIDRLADFLFERLLKDFSCNAEDNSPEEVAGLILRLYQECDANNFTLAHQILQVQAAPASASKGQQGFTYIDETGAPLDRVDGDSNHDEDEEMQTDEGVPSRGQGVSTGEASGGGQSQGGSQPSAPVVDEEGFTMVVRRKGRK
ncbi:unnamed protein product [Vitrella brassicaformis CCMP3155]|uniref:Pre-rRNA-processing protein TSR2 homolog n=1 Tax=Vitrella brassicaformis (strain CCMP3155) TaxID=1169540 RepID=A0A0G4GQR9_VITBC|nr:unnamed protein product [Vitrella brassicaformis CCMP3155]|mmetsp:Transcript_32150/g.79670  ORF Transcript_32150/g.79670 Transcript_32150/m.79670 type:complete len:207 (-) Transcript_32150:214-834(-)|eukprot:CEM32649.1 unnamed protein product [Vitrella brassicaformis CCMP3155]